MHTRKLSLKPLLSPETLLESGLETPPEPTTLMPGSLALLRIILLIVDACDSDVSHAYCRFCDSSFRCFIFTLFLVDACDSDVSHAYCRFCDSSFRCFIFTLFLVVIPIITVSAYDC